MARYQIILAYDGTGYLGSQRQAARKDGGGASRTVQGELEKALREIGWSGRSVLLAGRTDSGVHASGQVAAFDMDWQHAPEDLLRALNATLPADMAVVKVLQAEPDFHPRFAATSRCYRYRLFCRQVRDPLRERYAWRVWPPVQGELLAEAAVKFLGQHDFSAYGSPPQPGGSSLRTVTQAAWAPEQDEWHFEIRANAFLYRMVRRLVFVQVAVAQGKVPAETVESSLAGQADGLGRSELPSGLAPPQGLTLVEVWYGEE